ncbi:MAG: hypothetical protein VYB39_02335 [Pseudomonadota bacterium]|nr:hypothetical protein [Pseudomonadota bacterium]
MSEPLERNQVIELLDKLGSEQDQDVLAAARLLHSQIADSGMSWEDLLVGDEPEDEDDLEDEDDAEESFEADDYDYTADETVEPDATFTVDETETLSLIEKLLVRRDLSVELREELEEYKTDISDGEFETSDHRYVQALYARLTKN